MLIGRGIFNHNILIPTEDKAALEVWYSLTFGQWVHVAARNLDPLPAFVPLRSDLRVEQVSVDHLDQVMNLFFNLAEYDTSSPMFVPYLVNEEGWRQHEKNIMAEPDVAYLLAFDGETLVGVLNVGKPREESAHAPENRAFVWEAFVAPEARRQGVGTALLHRAIEWARDNGFDVLTLEYRSANLIGVPFWLSHGFRPFVTMLDRRIDERIVWARGR
jgi:GNAT superfamily N-acetyltransferase